MANCRNTKKLVWLLICSVLFVVHPAFAQWHRPQFTRLSTNEGLSQGHVNAILKDKQGFMWFATNEGLNKYDGYTFTIYKHYPETATSLSNNFVFDILEDKAGVMWVATQDGLDRFDRRKNVFSHYLRQFNIKDLFQDSRQRIWLGTTTGLCLFNSRTGAVTVYRYSNTDKNSLSDDGISHLTEDAAGNLWIGTQRGLTRFDPATGVFTRYLHDAGNASSIPSNIVRAVFRDKTNTIWIGMVGGGIARYNPAANNFDIFRHDAGNPGSLGHNDVLSLMEDAGGAIWAGTENGGISVLHRQTNQFTTFGYDVHDDKSLSNNSVYCLYKDDIDNIWVGTYSGGVNFASATGNKFRLYQNNPSRNSLSNDIVLSIAGDAQGMIWLGTDGGGLNRFDPATGQFTVFKSRPTPGNSPKSDFIITMAKAGKTTLALGYHRNGLDVFDTQKTTFAHYLPPGNEPNDVPVISINALYAGRNNTLWIGTWMHGLYVYDQVSKQMRHYVHDAGDPASLVDDSINALYEDESGLVWVGTENGLSCFDPRKRAFTLYRHDPRNGKSISSNTVNCLLGIDGARFWAGTAGGLCLFDKRRQSFTVTSEKNGLANNVVNGLATDAAGNVWMSTNRGISRYNPSSKAIRNYDQSDGLQGNEFKVNSVYQTPGGLLYFGGTNGFNIFNPDSIRDNSFVPPVYITDFQIFNKSVHDYQADSPLTEHISATRAISLTHDQGVFSFEFAALNYTLPQKNQYAYKLEGFDKEWNMVGHKRTATYTNLDPGEYLFRVKGSNNDGVWNTSGATVRIRILPPYWATWWFRLLAGLLLTGVAYSFYRNRMDAVQAQKWVLERIVDERTERLHQEQILNKMKSQFVSTASHEFRTPLATIQSSIDLVDMYLNFPADNGKPLIQKHLRIVENEIGKFGELLDDVLTIEKMSAGKVAFAPKLLDFGTVRDDVITTHFQTRKDHRSVETAVSGQPRPVLFDEKLIRHALVNLLSNAFKFSQTNPWLLTTFTDTELLIQVSDTGIGIPAKDMPHLFETFFRAENVSTIQGTGLGLFITKQAIERHGGSIRVESQEEVGTTFTITLPA